MNQSFQKNPKFLKNDKSEKVGHLLAIEFSSSLHYANYELFNFIQDHLKEEIDEMSSFRNVEGEPLGVAVASLKCDISLSQAIKLQNSLFKNVPICVRFYTQQSQLQRFILSRSLGRIDRVLNTIKIEPPVVYIDNIHTDNISMVSDFFGQIGPITDIRIKNQKESQYFYYEIQYSTEVSAVKCKHIFSGNPTPFGIPHIGISYKRAIQRCFAVKNLENEDKEEFFHMLSCFGSCESIKYGNGEIFLLMDTTDASRAACALLNERQIGNSFVSTHFYDYEFFQKLSSNLS